jgi:outer membrane protein assembly factor BamB
MQYVKRVCVALLGVLVFVSAVNAADWPQFRGPNRDGTSPETGLLKQWPKGGPKELWSFEQLGEGFSSIAIADGMVYLCGMLDGQGHLFAFDLDGKLKYDIVYGPEWTKAGNYPGTRTIPTIDGDRLYLMSGQGRIACYKAKTGELVWHIDTGEKFQGSNIRWGIAESVLIDGEKAICTPGGKDATVVALNKMTGETIWTSKGLSQLSAYCSPMPAECGPNRLILTLVEKAIVGIDANTGKVYWVIPHKVSYDIQAVSPLYQDGIMYVTNAYRHGSHGFSLSPDGTSIEKKWSEKSLDVHHGGVMLVDGHLHGASSRGEWICLDLQTGKVRFTDRVKSSDRLVGKGSVIYVDGMLYGYGEKGDVGLIRIKPDGYELVSSFPVKKGSKQHWAHPAISDGRLYVRHGEALMCYDIKAQ